jgi:hypothetical protein
LRDNLVSGIFGKGIRRNIFREEEFEVEEKFHIGLPSFLGCFHPSTLA